MRKPTSKNLPAVAIGRGLYQDPPPAKVPRDRGMAWLILGALFVAATFVLWQAESFGGILRLAWTRVDINEYGGKWVLCSLSLLVGIGFFSFGVLEWVRCHALEERSSPRP